ncbi:hypothetical protein [Longibacter sp.]|uniref:hypothetical protein n=1 Tax=Longibacter sp. TaxID=2045415 RepID=UPI003EBE1597
MVRYFILLLAVFPTVAAAQTGMDRIGSARSVALALATTADELDSGVHVNPAIPGYTRRRAVTVFGRQPFGLAELRHAAVALRLPVPGAVLQTGAGTFGHEAYRETFMTVSAARRLSLGTSRTLSVGVGARYQHVGIEGFPSAQAFSFRAGFLVPVLASLTAGIRADNLTGSSIAGEPLPRSLSVGLHYRATPTVNLYSDVYKDVAFPWSLRGGIEVWPVTALAVRAGAARFPARFTLGTGVRLRGLAIDVSAESHPDLGWSHGGGLSLTW